MLGTEPQPDEDDDGAESCAVRARTRRYAKTIAYDEDEESFYVGNRYGASRKGEGAVGKCREGLGTFARPIAQSSGEGGAARFSVDFEGGSAQEEGTNDSYAVEISCVDDAERTGSRGEAPR